MNVYRVVIAVDHYDLLENAQALISQHRNFILAGEAAIGSELLTLLNSTPADVAVVSMASPNQMKREIIRLISKRYPKLKLLFIHSRSPSRPVKNPFRTSGWNFVSGSRVFNNTAPGIAGIQPDLFQKHWAPLLIEQ